MSESEEENLHPDDAARGIAHRKRVEPPPIPRRDEEADLPPATQPDGVMSPSEGFDPDPYAPAGQLAGFATMVQSLKRRLRRRR